jgi:CubicO group peptidase (beta-lactamase class C family)
VNPGISGFVKTSMARTRLIAVGVPAALAAILATGIVVADRRFENAQVSSLADLDRELEALRTHLRIPGMSAAIAHGERLTWARGFGLANVERATPAAPETLYHLASLTKPYGSTMVLQLVEEGRLGLDDAVSRFGVTMERSTPVTVRHLLSHTSGEPPGSAYRYDGNAFGALTGVVEHVTGQPFAAVLVDRVIRPLGLAHTAPNPGDPREFWSLVASLRLSAGDTERARAAFAASGLDRGPIEGALAQGYARAWGRWIWPTGLLGPMRPMPHGFTLSTTGGLVASAPDVARFSMAIDDGRLLKETTRALAWQPARSADGTPLPYALGWFVQQHQGRTLVWHYGHGLESSSLIVKIPARRATFVVLANSDGLSRWRSLGDKADVTASLPARLFLRWFFAQNPN